MTDMKLGKLPNRTPVKYAITVLPDLNTRLQEYAAMYNEAHQNGGEPEELEDLIPYMLEAFLDSDRAFARRLKQQKRGALGTEITVSSSQGRRRQNGANPS